MIRQRLSEQGFSKEEHFRWRGTEVTRIEGLSDAVFAFAVTLLVVSLEVPHTFAELMHVMQGFGAFAISFSLLILIWYNHFLFFRRYGLQDRLTLVLNGALLFVVLFYIYPLKFLFSLLIGLLFGLPGAAAAITPAEAPTLMTIYSLGFLSVFLIFFLLHLHAYRKRAVLELDALEIFTTRNELSGLTIYMGVALLSITIALAGGARGAGWAGWCYALLGPAMTIHGALAGKRRRKLQKPA